MHPLFRHFFPILGCLLAFTAILDARAADPVKPADEVRMEKVVITRFLSDGTVRNDTILSPGEIIIQSESEVVSPLVAKRYGTKSPVVPSDMMRSVMVGLELSTDLDLSSTDLSTFNADLLFGYRHKVIQLLGASVGVHKSMGSSDCFIPIQAVFRTGFSPRPTLCFMHLSAGYSFNTIADSHMFGDTMATLGVGVNLARSRKFQSNIVLAFGFRHLNERHRELTSINKPNLGFTQISFGISM